MSASWWWQSRKLMFLPSLHSKKRKKKDCACSKIKIEAFYLRERWWTWNEGRSPAQLLYIPDALQTKWWKLEFCSLRAFPSVVSLSNLIFPMNDTFRISDGTNSTASAEVADTQLPQRHPPRRNPSPGGEKKKRKSQRMKMKPTPQIKCRWRRKVVGI